MLGATGIAIRLLVAVLEVVNRTEQPMPGSIDGTHQHGGKNSENTSHLSLSLSPLPLKGSSLTGCLYAAQLT